MPIQSICQLIQLGRTEQVILFFRYLIIPVIPSDPGDRASKDVLIQFGRIADEIVFIPVDLFVFEFHTKAG